jgi:hypothetical protein
VNDNPTFTPGPWRASEFWSPPIGNFAYKAEDKDANGNVFYGYSIHGRNEHGCEILPTLAAVHNFPDHIKANAHLIAAAPELYDLVKEMLGCMDEVMVERHDGGGLAALGITHSDEGCSLCKARRVLAKAEGRS